MQLSYTQIGLITLVFQGTASLLQPAIGLYADRSPKPFSLAIGMGFTLAGLLLLSFAASFAGLLAAAALVGVGSAVFHPESSRVARMAAGGRYGFAQSFFQVGGNIGSAIGPLAAAFIVLPSGQGAVAWFSLAALAAILILSRRRPAGTAASLPPRAASPARRSPCTASRRRGSGCRSRCW